MSNKGDANSQWFKIKIAHGVEHYRQTFLQLIHSQTQLTFTPYNYYTEGNAVFYVLVWTRQTRVRQKGVGVVPPTPLGKVSKIYKIG